MTFVPCPTDGAQTLVDANFDEHMEMQHDAFLQPGRHEEAKYHGKLRAKFIRMALSLSMSCKQSVRPGGLLPMPQTSLTHGG